MCHVQMCDVRRCQPNRDTYDKHNSRTKDEKKNA